MERHAQPASITGTGTGGKGGRKDEGETPTLDTTLIQRRDGKQWRPGRCGNTPTLTEASVRREEGKGGRKDVGKPPTLHTTLIHKAKGHRKGGEPRA